VFNFFFFVSILTSMQHDFLGVQTQNLNKKEASYTLVSESPCYKKQNPKFLCLIWQTIFFLLRLNNLLFNVNF